MPVSGVPKVNGGGNFGDESSEMNFQECAIYAPPGP